MFQIKTSLQSYFRSRIFIYCIIELIVPTINTHALLTVWLTHTSPRKIYMSHSVVQTGCMPECYALSDCRQQLQLKLYGGLEWKCICASYMSRFTVHRRGNENALLYPLSTTLPARLPYIQFRSAFATRKLVTADLRQ